MASASKGERLRLAAPVIRSYLRGARTVGAGGVPRCNVALSVLLHELATDAPKYGALSDATGSVAFLP